MLEEAPVPDDDSTAAVPGATTPQHAVPTPQHAVPTPQALAPAPQAAAPQVVTPSAPTTRTGRALADLAALDSTPLAGHPDIYQRVHAELQGALAEIDNA